MKNKNIFIGIAIAIVAVLVVGLLIFSSKKDNSRGIKSYLDLGNKFLKELDYQSAVAEFDKAIAVDPKNSEAYLGKIAAYLGLGDSIEENEDSFEYYINAYITLRVGQNNADKNAFDEIYSKVLTKVGESAKWVSGNGTKDIDVNLAHQIVDLIDLNNDDIDKLIDELGSGKYPEDSNMISSGSGNSDNATKNEIVEVNDGSAGNSENAMTLEEGFTDLGNGAWVYVENGVVTEYANPQQKMWRQRIVGNVPSFDGQVPVYVQTNINGGGQYNVTFIKEDFAGITPPDPTQPYESILNHSTGHTNYRYVKVTSCIVEEIDGTYTSTIAGTDDPNDNSFIGILYPGETDEAIIKSNYEGFFNYSE